MSSNYPKVNARLCPQGHPNAVEMPACRVCGKALAGQIVLIDPPILGKLRLSSGQTVALTGAIVVGRAPVAPREWAGFQPLRLLPLDSARQQISRTHLLIHTNEWEVLATDLGSENGSDLLRGRNRFHLIAHQPYALQPGDVLFLGEDTHLFLEHGENNVWSVE